ncbi:hypothetical protein OAJ56_00050 [Flavobacteriales bacterium]|nr:hypothetical protein [Flavobacteriales bacterium]
MKKLLLIALTTVLFGCNGCLEEVSPPPKGMGYGECEGDCENGYGKWTFTSKEFKGDTKEGNWKNGKMNGQGTYTEANGTVEEGLWENDEFIGE